MDATAPPGSAVTIYTAGHSRHRVADFIALLAARGVRRVLDTRGQPWSRHNPQYNREPFRRALEAAGIAWEWHGDRLSGRPREPEFRGPGGEVLWDRLRASPMLAGALDEVAARAAREPLALVCAEEDPRRCHRRFLLTPPLVARGLEVLHLRGDGRIEPEADLRAGEDRGQLDLFGEPR